MSNSKNYPAVGIALIMTHQQQVLTGRRIKQPMEGSWQLPGGWLHYHEQPLQAVKRLQQRFDGMVCGAARFSGYTSNQFETGEHSVSLYFQLACDHAEAVDLQQNKECSDWIWCDWYDLPQPLFLPLALLKESGYQPFID